VGSSDAQSAFNGAAGDPLQTARPTGDDTETMNMTLQLQSRRFGAFLSDVLRLIALVLVLGVLVALADRLLFESEPASARGVAEQPHGSQSARDAIAAASAPIAPRLTVDNH